MCSTDALPLLLHEPQPPEPLHPVLQAPQRVDVHAGSVGQVGYAVAPGHPQELRQPALPVVPAQRVGGVRRDLRQVERLPQQHYVVRLHLVVADAHNVVRRKSPPLRARLVQREDRHLRVEQLLEPLHLRARLAVPPPAVLALHVEDQVHRRAALEDARQQQPGQERLARAALAEHAVAAHHQLRHVQAQLRVHVQRAADPEVAVAFAPEDALDVLLRGCRGRREVGRHRLRRLRPLQQHLRVVPGYGEHRLDRQRAIRRRA